MALRGGKCQWPREGPLADSLPTPNWWAGLGLVLLRSQQSGPCWQTLCLHSGAGRLGAGAAGGAGSSAEPGHYLWTRRICDLSLCRGIGDRGGWTGEGLRGRLCRAPPAPVPQRGPRWRAGGPASGDGHSAHGRRAGVPALAGERK